MALTLGTNSYIDAADADVYFDDRLYADEWIGADSGDKDKALLMARRVLDQQPFAGTLSDPDQMLAWPRTGVYGADPDTVPKAVIDAQCELALAFLREDLTADDGTRGVRRLKAGSVEIEYDGRAPSKRLPDASLALLEPFLVVTENAHSLAMVL